MLINKLRAKWKLKELLLALKIAKSSYEYASHVLSQNESPAYTKTKQAVIAIFENNDKTYGYRRVLQVLKNEKNLKVSEWAVRNIMQKEKLFGKCARKKRRYSSYKGEISDAPNNLLRNEGGSHDFSANAPNKKWVSDITKVQYSSWQNLFKPNY